MAEYLSQQLIQGGFAPEDVKITEVAGTATLVARYRGNGSKKPMLISNHMDVVEAIPSDWTRDPFTMVTENGYHFGRGVYDNKLDVALTVSTLLRLKKEGFKPSRDIILALSGDEETDMLSTQALSTQFPDAEFLLNGDGGGGTLAATGKPWCMACRPQKKPSPHSHISVSNPGGHSSRPRKDNAIYELADALQKFSAYEFPVQSSEQTRGSFGFTGKQIGGELGPGHAALRRQPERSGSRGDHRGRPGICRHAAHHLRGHHVERWPCRKCLAAARHRHRELPDFPGCQR